MRRRAEKLEIPDLPHILWVEIEDYGRVPFALPDEIRQAELLRFIADVGDPSADPIGNFRINMTAVAVIVGECWFHPELELETEQTGDSDEELVAWGRQLLAEWHRAGWYSSKHIAPAALELSKLMAQVIIDPEEVDRMVGFFSRRAAAGSSDSSGGK